MMIYFKSIEIQYKWVLFSCFEFFHGSKQAVAKNYSVETLDDDVKLVSTLFSMKQTPGVSLESYTEESDEEFRRGAPNKRRYFTTTYELFARLYFFSTSV